MVSTQTVMASSLPLCVAGGNTPGTIASEPGQYLVEPAVLRSCDKRFAGHSLPGSQLGQALVAEGKDQLAAAQQKQHLCPWALTPLDGCCC